MKLNFKKLGGLVPAVIQDSRTHQVLMVGFMNKAAYKKTLEIGKVTFYSRTKERLWTKGEKSGHFLIVDELIKDCDSDSILIKAIPLGPTCHKGTDSCFDTKSSKGFIYRLESIINDRKKVPNDESYTSNLFSRGLNKIAQKVGEEAVELIIEAKESDQISFINEAADLMYHIMVLLAEKEISFEEIEKSLQLRHKFGPDLKKTVLE